MVRPSLIKGWIDEISRGEILDYPILTVIVVLIVIVMVMRDIKRL